MLVYRDGAKRARTADLLGAIQVQATRLGRGLHVETAWMQGFDGSNRPFGTDSPLTKKFSWTRIGHASGRPA